MLFFLRTASTESETPFLEHTPCALPFFPKKHSLKFAEEVQVASRDKRQGRRIALQGGVEGKRGPSAQE